MICKKYADVVDGNSSSADVFQGLIEFNRSIDLPPNAKHLSMVGKSAFTDILNESAWSHT